MSAITDISGHRNQITFEVFPCLNMLKRCEHVDCMRHTNIYSVG